MAARRKVLTLDSVNPRVKGSRLPTLGPLLERASQIQRQLAQVAAICAYPELLHADSMPRDAKQRASRILPELHSSSAEGAGGSLLFAVQRQSLYRWAGSFSQGAYNMEYVTAAIPQRVARYLERRDGGIRNIVTCGGITMAIAVSLPSNLPRPQSLLLAMSSSRRPQGRCCSPQDFLSLVVNELDPRRAGMLLPVPGHPLYADAVGLAGAVGVQYHLDEEGGWALDVGEIRWVLGQARGYCPPKVLCVINPGYPTGRGAFRAGFFELANIDPAIMKCFCSWGMSVYPLILGQVLLDALMEPLLPGDPSCPHLYGSGCCMLHGRGKQAALSNLAHKAQLTQEIFGPVPGIRCNPVQGAMYSFPRIQIPARAVQEAQALSLEPDFFFCQKLLEATGIVLAPESTFGVMLLPSVKTLRIVLQTTADFHSQFLQQYS
ncbi:alanine aminotransferase 2-like [Lepidochelys kempii]|uniref:alanine aminotransferase 2-like n=1 Tax=Lepidochelys kempii TaxID=8472 RepID=UPI003C6FFED1